MNKPGDISRRAFAKAAGAVAVAPMIVPSSVLGQRAGAVPPSDRIVMGGIGIGVRGENDLRAFLSFTGSAVRCHLRCQE